MANSRYDFLKEEEKALELRFHKGVYIIVRIDGENFHSYSNDHNFHKPNDKRALDLMVKAAKRLMLEYKGDISLAYGHSDEFSFLIKSSSNLLSRRIIKIASVLPNIFATYYNWYWKEFFEDPNLGKVTPAKRPARFDAKVQEYPNYRAVIDYFRWRQVDCHINNLYNTTLHAMTGRYVKHEWISSEDSSGTVCIKKTPITEWILKDYTFFTSSEATEKLSKTISSDKHDILFRSYKINYNNELEQFKKGTVIVCPQRSFAKSRKGDDEYQTISHYNAELIKDVKFWDEHSYVFDDFYDSRLVNKT